MILKMKNWKDLSLFLITFLKLWNIIMCQESTMFERTLATTDYLAEVTTFAVTSRIECGAVCLVKMNHNNCTAFAIDEMSGTCTCGRKRFAPVQETDSVALLYVTASCPKIKTGQLKKYQLTLKQKSYVLTCSI